MVTDANLEFEKVTPVPEEGARAFSTHVYLYDEITMAELKCEKFSAGAFAFTLCIPIRYLYCLFHNQTANLSGHVQAINVRQLGDMLIDGA